MQITRIGQALFACLAVALGPGDAPAQGPSTMAPAVQWMDTTPDADAGDYLAHLIRTFGCVVGPEQRAAFEAVVLTHLQLDFGLPAGAGRDRMLSRSLFRFGHRAGAYLIEAERLTVDEDGTAFLLNCGNLTS